MNIPLNEKVVRGGHRRGTYARSPWSELLRPYLPTLFFLGALLYHELFFRIFVGFSETTNLLYPLLFTIPAALLAGGLCSLLPPKGGFALAIVLTSVTTVGFCTQMIYHYIFKVHLTMYSFSVGVGQAMGFMDAALQAIGENILPLLVLFVPLILLCVFGRRFLVFERTGWLRSVILFACFLVFHLALVLSIRLGDTAMYGPYDLYYKTANVDLSMEKLGFLTTTRLDLQRLLFGFNEGSLDLDLTTPSQSEPEPTPEPTPAPSESEPEESAAEPTPTPEPEPVVDTSPNIIESLDFEQLIADAPSDTVRTLHEYFQSVTPTNRNEYTGMFEGYNLVFLTAEGFSPYAVDPELTPTLYKLVNTGFHFSNYYTPIWGVSTSDGEYVACTSLVPKSGVWSFYRSGAQKNDMRFCLGNVFSAMGYQANAYHDHTYDYYGRDLSHPNMGYEYKAVGLGLDVKTTWPESDLEMMEKSVDDYINADHFLAYYMTVSGHLYYTFQGNSMSTKNRALVEDLDMSEEAKAYIACQIELDRALAYLINRLDEAGKLDNTVIVMGADHYPYGLSEETISEFLGHDVEKTFELYKSNLIIWNSQMKEPIEVEKPACQMDILPTVLNLFGAEYDSRLLMGHDILSDSEPFVLFADTSFITDKCMYRAGTGDVILLDEHYQPLPEDTEYNLPEGYITERRVRVTNMFKVSAAVLDNNYYQYVPDPE